MCIALTRIKILGRCHIPWFIWCSTRRCHAEDGVGNSSKVSSMTALYCRYYNYGLFQARFRHPNIVSIMGYSISPSGVSAMVYEYVAGGSLYDRLHGKVLLVLLQCRILFDFLLSTVQERPSQVGREVHHFERHMPWVGVSAYSTCHSSGHQIVSGGWVQPLILTFCIQSEHLD